LEDEAPDPFDYRLKVRVEGHGSTITVHPIGDLDMATARVLRAALAADLHEFRSVVVDLAGVTFMDSTGLAALLEARRALLADGRTLTVQHAQAQTRQLLELAGIADLLTGRTTDRTTDC
jgi:anti-anti-sigma factor